METTQIEAEDEKRKRHMVFCELSRYEKYELKRASLELGYQTVSAMLRDLIRVVLSAVDEARVRGAEEGQVQK